MECKSWSIAAYVDEHALTPTYAAALGVDIAVRWFPSSTGESALKYLINSFALLPLTSW